MLPNLDIAHALPVQLHTDRFVKYGLWPPVWIRRGALNCLFLCAACARRADQRAGMPGIAYVVAAVQPGGDIASVDAVSTVLIHGTASCEHTLPLIGPLPYRHCLFDRPLFAN